MPPTISRLPLGVRGRDRWEGRSLYGAPGLQPVAISGKSPDRKTRGNKRNPLPPVAPTCLRRSMAGRLPWAASRCGRSPPCEGGGRALAWLGGYFLLQSGHGHSSHPQPVHAGRTATPGLYRRRVATARSPTLLLIVRLRMLALADALSCSDRDELVGARVVDLRGGVVAEALVDHPLESEPLAPEPVTSHGHARRLRRWARSRTPSFRTRLRVGEAGV